MSEENELQGVTLEAGEEQVQQPTEEPSPTEGADLATATDAGQEEKPEGDKPAITEGAQEAINKQHKKFRDEERLRLSIEEERDNLRQELEQARGTNVEPVIPAPPDPYAEDYAEQMAERDAAIEAHASWTTEQKINANRELQTQQAERDKHDKALAEKATAYGERAKKLNVDGVALQQASQVVASYQLRQEIVETLLEHDDGPLLTQYLAGDLETLDTIARMPIHTAILHLEREVRPKAAALRPKTSDAPNPPDTLAGGGVSDDGLGSHKGVTIE